MKLIFTTPYINIYYYESFNILYVEWTEIADTMTQEEFRAQIVTFVEEIKVYGAKGFLADSQKGHFTMNIDTQEWHDREIVPKYLAYGLTKIAFVLPEKDLFASISLQQTFDEVQAQRLQTRFFDNVENALEWIKIRSSTTK